MAILYSKFIEVVCSEYKPTILIGYSVVMAYQKVRNMFLGASLTENDIARMKSINVIARHDDLLLINVFGKW